MKYSPYLCVCLDIFITKKNLMKIKTSFLRSEFLVFVAAEEKLTTSSRLPVIQPHFILSPV